MVFRHNSRRRSHSQLHLLLEQLHERLAEILQGDEPMLRCEELVDSFAGHSEEAQLRGDALVCWAARLHEMPQQAIQAKHFAHAAFDGLALCIGLATCFAEQPREISLLLPS